MSDESYAGPETAVVIDPNFELESTSNMKRLLPRRMWATLLNYQFKGKGETAEEYAMFGSANFAAIK